MTKILFSTSVALTTALALVATAAPAAARGEGERDAVESSSAGSNPTSANPQPREKRYCVVTTPTGTRLSTKICKSRKEWESEGVDIPADR